LKVFVFPGQGLSNKEFLRIDDSNKEKLFEYIQTKYQLVVNEDTFNDHIVNSLIITANSISKFQSYSELKKDISFYAGYSVGQYAALACAGVIDIESAIDIVYHRSKMMKDFTNTNFGMMNVLGINENLVQKYLDQNNANLEITNYNAINNCTVGGDLAALTTLKAQLESQETVKVSILPLSGAWHSSYLKPAESTFRKLLKNYTFDYTKLHRCFDNVSGNLFTNDPTEFKEKLVAHLYTAVHWKQTLLNMSTHGITVCIEPCPGNMIGKMLFYTTRDLKYLSCNTNAELIKCAEFLV
jgi:[acyl-carrier-protein] S-malonyltransferase